MKKLATTLITLTAIAVAVKVMKIRKDKAGELFQAVSLAKKTASESLFTTDLEK